MLALHRSCPVVLGVALALFLLAPGVDAEEPAKPCGPPCPGKVADPPPATPVVATTREEAPPRRQVASDAVGLGRRIPDAAAKALEDSLADGLRERDGALRLGRGAIISAASAFEVRREMPAGESTATIVVDVDATGTAQRVVVLAATAHDDAWERIAIAIDDQLAGRPLGGNFGPHGARVTLRIELRRRYPSGHDKLFEIRGLGLLFDLSDLATRKRRQVHVWIVEERAAAAAVAAPAAPVRAAPAVGPR